MTLEEMQAECLTHTTESTEAPADDHLWIAFNDGLFLLKQVKVFLSYVSDPELCKTLSKRERDVADRLIGKLGEYLDEMSVTYDEA
jgi:hypothetical protein